MRTHNLLKFIGLPLGLALMSGSANAVFINGSLGYSDGLINLPQNDNSIVSELTIVSFDDLDGGAPGTQTQIGGSNGDLAGLNGVGGLISQFDSITPAWTLEIGAFTFTLETITDVDVGAFSCDGNLCRDSINWDFTGQVTAAGFDPTFFVGNLGLEGSCVGSPAGCTSAVVGSYSGTLVATGRPEPVPNPGTLALLGAGVLGFSAARRSRLI